MKFIYKAKDIEGRELKGEIETPDKFAGARELREKGLTVVSIKSVAEKSKFSLDAINKAIGGVKLREKIVFANNLSSMISAGLSLGRSLSVIERQTKNKYFKKVLKDLIKRINDGQSLSGAMSAYPNVFPPVFISMIEAGEQSGNLPKSLETVSGQMQKTYELRRKVKGAMIYPAIIIIAIIVIAILMMIFLIPTLTATFNDLGVELPLMTRIVIGSSNFMVNNILWVILVSALFFGFLFYYLKTENGKKVLSFIFLRLPVIGSLVREVNSAVIMRTTSSLISSGVSMIETIKITENVVQNYYYKQALIELSEKVQKGSTLSEVFQKYEKIFPVFVGEMTMVGEETGNLPKMLLKGAEFYEEEVDQATKNLSTIIEPVLMLIIGLAVGLFAVSIIGPMYSLTDAIR